MRVSSFLLAGLLSLPFVVHAEESQVSPVENGQVFGAWRVNCVAIGVGKTDCTLIQRVLRAEDRAFIADLAAAQNDKGETFVVARVAIGAHLPTVFAMRDAASADQAEVLKFTWQTCSPKLCEAAAQLSSDQRDGLSGEDNKMIAAFRPSARSEPIIFQLSFNGLAQGLEALRPIAKQ